MDAVVRFAEYIRVSGAGQAERETQRVQREALLRLRERRTGVLVPGNGPDGAFEDIAISGTKGEDERPGWAAVMRLLRAGQIQELRVHAIDRCTRSDQPTAWAALAEDLTVGDCVLVETNGAVTDLRGKQSFDVLMLMFKASGAAEERRRITKRFLDGRRSSAGAQDAKGGWGSAPYGYRYDKRMGYVIDDGEVTPGVSKVQLIQRVFHLGLTHSARQIAQVFTAEGIPTPKGISQWSGASIHAWHLNPAYKGSLVGQLPPELSDRGVPLPPPPGVQVKTDREGTHWEYTVRIEPIVAVDLWDRVQVARRARRNERPEDYVGADALFRYLAHCGACGAKLLTLNKANRGVRYPTYTCRNKTCTTKASFRMGAIDAIAWNTIVERLCASDLLTEPSSSSGSDEDGVVRARALAAIAEAEREVKELFRRFSGKSGSLRAAMEARCDELDVTIEHHRGVLRRLDDHVAQRAAFQARAMEARSHVLALRATLKDGISFERKRELTKLLLGAGAGRLVIHPGQGGRARLEIESDLLASTGRLAGEGAVESGMNTPDQVLRLARVDSATPTRAPRSPR